MATKVTMLMTLAFSAPYLSRNGRIMASSTRVRAPQDRTISTKSSSVVSVSPARDRHTIRPAATATLTTTTSRVNTYFPATTPRRPAGVATAYRSQWAASSRATEDMGMVRPNTATRAPRMEKSNTPVTQKPPYTTRKSSSVESCLRRAAMSL